MIPSFNTTTDTRPNNEITRSESYAQAKVQVTPQDSIFFQTKYQDTRQGDLLQRYDQTQAELGVNFRELQQPAIILVGYHHEWAPGNAHPSSRGTARGRHLIFRSQ